MNIIWNYLLNSHKTLHNLATHSLNKFIKRHNIMNNLVKIDITTERIRERAVETNVG